jgi:cytochrome c oxidase subunit IV
MSTPTHEEMVAADHEVVDPHEEAHPKDRTYVLVALWLGVLTALEVSTYFVDFGDIAVALLLTLMAIKFAVVALYFMHLRFDSRLFRRLFITGIITALAVYTAALTMFQYWTEPESDQVPPPGAGAPLIQAPQP